MRQPAAHRLLLLLSDGRPNDEDDYDGRYGVEGTRQAATEARLQGIFPFCFSVGRQGAGHYALLCRVPSCCRRRCWSG